MIYFVLNHCPHLHLEMGPCYLCIIGFKYFFLSGNIFSMVIKIVFIGFRYFSLSGNIFSMLQINKNRFSKRFPDVTDTLKSHDPEMALLKYLRKYCSWEFILKKEMTV